MEDSIIVIQKHIVPQQLTNVGLASLAIIALAAGSSEARFGPSIAGSAYLNSVLETRAEEEPAPAPSGDLHRFAARAETEAPSAATLIKKEEPFWKAPEYSLSYEFEHRDSSLPDNERTNTNTLELDYIRSNQRQFEIDLKLGYAHSDIQSAGSVHNYGNDYYFSVTPAQEFLHLLMQKPPKGMELSAGLEIGYRHTSLDGSDGEGNEDALALGPVLTVQQKFSAVACSASALYAYETVDMDPHAAQSEEGSEGIFGILGLLEVPIKMLGDDGKPEDRGVFAAFAQWNHDVQVDAEGPRDDWAEFGTYFGWRVFDSLKAQLQYSVETLRTDYTSHKGSLQLTWELG